MKTLLKGLCCCYKEKYEYLYPLTKNTDWNCPWNIPK